MKTPSLFHLAACFLAATVWLVVPVRTATADGFHWHHWQGRTTMVVSGVPASNVSFVPVSAMQAVSVAPTTTSGLQFVPVGAVQSSGVSAGQVVQFTPVSASMFVPSGVGSSGVVFVQGSTTQAQSGFVPVGQSAGTSSFGGVGAGGGTPDYDLSVLAVGFGNRPSKVNALSDHLKGLLPGLLGKGLSGDQNTTLLMDAAKSFMTNQGFGFVINDAIEPILKRLIAQLLQQSPAPAPSNNKNNAPVPPNTPSPSVGGQSFTVTGTIVLTPATGTTQPATPNGPVVPPPNNDQLAPGPDSNTQPAPPPSQ